MALSQSTLNGYIAAVGAAGGMAFAVTLVYPKAGRWVVLGAFGLTLIVSLGLVALLDAEVNPS